MSPADFWIGALWAEGVGLFVLSLGYQGNMQGLGYFPCLVFGVAFGVTALFFAAAVPTPGSEGNPLTQAALRLLRLVPAPGRWTRALALVACGAPFGAWSLWVLDPRWPEAAGGATAGWVFALCLCLLLGSVARAPNAGRAASWWDGAAPCLMCALVATYGLAMWAIAPSDPALGAFGLTLTGLAQLVLLRQAAARHWEALATIAQTDRGVPDVTIPLDEYRAQTEAMAPPVRQAAPSVGDGPALVDSGTFRIDASKMLEKLRERQLADAGDFIKAWLRCAVASGAKTIRLEQDWDLLLMSFDGRPFTQAQLRDPYQALLDREAKDSQRGAQFSYGLLAVLRLKPHAIWVYSGEGRERALTRLASSGSLELPAPRDPKTGTLVAVSFGLAGLWRVFLANRAAGRAFGLADAELTINGRPAPRAFAPEDGWKSTEARDEWRIAWRPRLGEPASRIRIYHLGALVEELQQPLQTEVQLDAAFTHPDLVLSISQSSVVRDDRFKKGLAHLEARAPR